MRIRAAEAGDFATIAAITNHYIAGTAIHFGYQAVSGDELRATWRAAVGTYPWLVTEQDGAVIAYAKAGEWRSRDAYRWTTEVGIYVEAGRRGGGIGVALYRELLAALAAAGFHSVIGGITLPNPASIALHERCGFVHVGTVREAGFKHDAWHDVAFYQRML